MGLVTAPHHHVSSTEPSGCTRSQGACSTWLRGFPAQAGREDGCRLEDLDYRWSLLSTSHLLFERHRPVVKLGHGVDDFGRQGCAELACLDTNDGHQSGRLAGCERQGVHAGVLTKEGGGLVKVPGRSRDQRPSEAPVGLLQYGQPAVGVPGLPGGEVGGFEISHGRRRPRHVPGVNVTPWSWPGNPLAMSAPTGGFRPVCCTWAGALGCDPGLVVPV